KSGLVFDDALVETLHRELLGHDARLMGCLHFHQNGVPFPFQGVLSDQVETRALYNSRKKEVCRLNYFWFIRPYPHIKLTRIIELVFHIDLT
ncbi:hypothetical protein, partial [Desulfovibrio sp. ZJ200]|uniref:hypothetical protein n=1 Tax=Desulfovibrio sp. ZJ200 TaxID=2709792 RepID=UPI00197FEACF